MSPYHYTKTTNKSDLTIEIETDELSWISNENLNLIDWNELQYTEEDKQTA